MGFYSGFKGLNQPSPDFTSMIYPAAAPLLRSWVRIPPGAWIFVCCECRVLLGRGLCDELITLPEESYPLWCVVVCDLETSRMGAPYIYIYDISSLRVNNIPWLPAVSTFDCLHSISRKTHSSFRIIYSHLYYLYPSSMKYYPESGAMKANIKIKIATHSPALLTP